FAGVTESSFQRLQVSTLLVTASKYCCYHILPTHIAVTLNTAVKGCNLYWYSASSGHHAQSCHLLVIPLSVFLLS
ncbi:hypothetical protein NDU88_005708, partial [Pleurodeles waltl]